MNRTKITLISLLMIACASWQMAPANGANILGLFTSHSPSHLIVHMSIVKVLAERGHNVTVVASSKPKVTHKDIHVIVIPPTKEQEEILNSAVENMGSKKHNLITILQNFFGSLKMFIDIQADMLKDSRFTVLYDNPDTKFDLVIFGFFMNSHQLGVAAKFKAPVIVSWMSAPNVMMDRWLGNPSESSYVPNAMMAPAKLGEGMTFLQRVQNYLINAIFGGIMQILDIRMRTFYKDLFPNDDTFPTLYDMYKNVSLLFCNSHFSEGPIRPNVPAVVEIGGIQIKDTPDPLPKDIAELLDEAKNNGAILFSLGSNFKGSSVKPETATYIFNVLSKLKQKVIWKWEDLEHTPGNAPNILYKKWLPQDDILAHPNLKLFITHAGKGGIVEAQYHGVPMLAIPIFGDQHPNAVKMVQSGYGLMVDYLSLTEEGFKAALLGVLNNPVYRVNVQQFSRLYRDRPLSARENVVFWVEYVLRHHGAGHMQSPLVHMNFIQSMNLDVYALLLLVVYILYRIFRLAIFLVWARLGRKCICAADKSKKIKKAKKAKKQ